MLNELCQAALQTLWRPQLARLARKTNGVRSRMQHTFPRDRAWIYAIDIQVMFEGTIGPNIHCRPRKTIQIRLNIKFITV